MPKAIPTKETFGTVRIDHFSPALSEEAPKAINITLSFEEALKLNIGLQAALMKLNGYNRNTKAGKASAINLCVFTESGRITINEDAVRKAE